MMGPNAAAGRPGLLTVEFELAPEGEEWVNCWYYDCHIREIIVIPGFTDVRRYRSTAGPLRHLTAWEVTDCEWPFTPEYRSIPLNGWASWLADRADPALRAGSTRTGLRELAPSAAPAMSELPTAMWMETITVGLDEVEILTSWYDNQRIPHALRHRSAGRVRRFLTLGEVTPGRCRHVMMCPLADPGMPPEPPREWPGGCSDPVLETWAPIPIPEWVFDPQLPHEAESGDRGIR